MVARGRSRAVRGEFVVVCAESAVRDDIKS